MSSKHIAAVAAIPLLLLVYLGFSSPGSVVVNAGGEIKGLLNHGRILLQGDDFWRDQLTLAKAELSHRRNQPQRLQVQQQRMDDALTEADALMEETYRKYPQLSPSPAEVRAEVLRQQADEIEWADIEAKLEQIRLRRISELESLLTEIENRLGD